MWSSTQCTIAASCSNEQDVSGDDLATGSILIHRAPRPDVPEQTGFAPVASGTSPYPGFAKEMEGRCD